MSKLHLLSIGAHIQDVEGVGCASLPEYHALGHSSSMYVTPVEPEHPAFPYADYEALKIRNVKGWASITGSDVLFMPYKDTGLPLMGDDDYHCYAAMPSAGHRHHVARQFSPGLAQDTRYSEPCRDSACG